MALTMARKDWLEVRDGVPVEHRSDVYLVDGQFAFVNGKESHKQTIESVIETVKGELQLDNGFGVPYFTTVFQDNFHLEMWATAVREMVSGLDFVESIEGFDYEYDFSMKKLTFALTVKTEDEGTITVTEEGA